MKLDWLTLSDRLYEIGLATQSTLTYRDESGEIQSHTQTPLDKTKPILQITILYELENLVIAEVVHWWKGVICQLVRMEKKAFDNPLIVEGLVVTSSRLAWTQAHFQVRAHHMYTYPQAMKDAIKIAFEMCAWLDIELPIG